jgi:hypothetical protein
MTMKDNKHILWLFGLMVLFTAMRWPGLLPWNFSPVYAIWFCSGVYFKDWRMWLVPVGLMFVSDIIMNYFHYRPMGFPIFTPYMLGTYMLYLVLALMGRLISEKACSATLIVGGTLGACGFFFASNLLAWLSNPVYAKTWAGLVQSFTVGEPGYPPTIIFLRNAALSGALFTALIVVALRYAQVNKKEQLVLNTEV